MTSRPARVSWLFAALIFPTIATLPAASAQESVIYSFVYGGSDGLSPYSSLTPDGAGNFYGTTKSGGAIGEPFGTDGTVYELSPAGTWTEKVIYNFGSANGDGTEPVSDVIFDGKGNLYGTTLFGGANNSSGTVYELSPAGGGKWTEKVLYSFGASSTDGVEPYLGNLTFDAKGNLYGTTAKGGTNGAGTVFELSPGSGGGWKEKVLYSFGASTEDGGTPYSGVTFDAAGNLYGTTYSGGTANTNCSPAGSCGTVYQLAPQSGGTWKETVLHRFDINNIDGAEPVGGVIFDSLGNLYGTTMIGGNYGNQDGLGTVYELSPSPEGEWIEQVLYSFKGGGANADGQTPVAGLVFDAAGNLYGTTEYGGVDQSGSVFVMTRAGGAWTEGLLYSFSSLPSDGHNPFSSVLFDAAGNLYGTTTAGGTNSAGLYGTVYQIADVITASPTFSPSGGTYKTAQKVKISDATPGAIVYYSLNESGNYKKYTGSISVSQSTIISAMAFSAKLPSSQVATAGYQIGSVAATPVFSPPAGTYSAPQSVSILDAAPHAVIHYTTNGSTPTASSPVYSAPIPVSTTKRIKAIAVAKGLTNSAVGSAKYTISKVVQPKEEVLYNFGATTTDGQVPVANLVSDGKGNLYGTSKYGGTNTIVYNKVKTTAGTVFELSPKTGGGWTETILYNLYANSNDAALPVAGLVFDSKGNLYGTSFAGGAHGLGAVFELSPAGGGTWTETVLYSFGVSLSDAAIPEAPLIMDTKGNLFGTTSVGGAYATYYGGGYGTVFVLSPATGGGWTETILHSFDLNGTDGYFPVAGVVFDSKGNLYGTTEDGGTGQDLEGGGTVFELSPSGSSWTEKVLYSFGGGATTGYNIVGGVVLDAKGNLYGTANAGGNGFGLDGTLFELSLVGGSWTEIVLHSFGAFEGDGVNPSAGLIFDSSGVNLYGTTFGGGANNAGTVFELLPQTGGGWIENVLHSFALNGTDGANPYASLIIDSSGNLYGTTAYGGTHGSSTTGGTVFEIVK